MALFWFLAGCLGALALVLVLLPLLRALPAFNSMPAALSPVLSLLAIVLSLSLGISVYRAREDLQVPARPTAAASAATATRDASGPGAASGQGAMSSTAGGSMDSAVASLEGKLAKGGGSPDEWELLAKSYEFLGRPEDARMARAHQLPAHAGTGPAAGSVAIQGDVTLADAVRARAAPDAVLFIVAKAVDSPGAPVAVVRQQAVQWPAHFTLDDSEAMMPDRTLSGATRVTIEARLSRSGQAMPSSGDLKGVSGAVDPRATGPVHLVIDQVVP